MKDGGFAKTMLASAVGALIAMIVMSVLSTIAFVAMLGFLAADEVVSIDHNSVLELDLSNTISERKATDMEKLLSDGKSIGLNSILKSIDNAAGDDRIKGIYLNLGMTYSAGWSQTQEIRMALENFKKSGKFIYAYSEAYSQKSYFLASVADTLVLNPSGMVEFTGIAAETMFIKDLLDKLDIKIDLIRPNNNAYKSAGEMYIMDRMSEASREQVRTYIMSIWNEILPVMSEARNIPVDSLNSFADNLSAFWAADALNAGLVDMLGFENDIKTIMAVRTGGEKASDVELASLKDYSASILDKESAKDKIAIIYAEGDVVMGKGYDVAVYSENMVKSLDKAAEDDDVKAIVLRVNSPGGVVNSAEIITDAVRRAKAKKPVVVSMSNLAASAGYEISCYASKIVAMPTTLTGSIGVFATVPEVGTMLKNKIGLTFDTVNTNKNSSALSVTRPLSAQSRALMAKNVEEFYTTFCTRVAEGRGLTVEYVDSIARGRVWTGKDALKLGLVDTLGGIDMAIRIAAAEAGLQKYRVADYSQTVSTFAQLMELFDEEARVKALIPEQYGKFSFYRELETYCNSTAYMQARMPYFINF